MLLFYLFWVVTVLNDWLVAGQWQMEMQHWATESGAVTPSITCPVKHPQPLINHYKLPSEKT